MDKDDRFYEVYQEFLDEEVEDLTEKFQTLNVSTEDSASHSCETNQHMVKTRSGQSYPSETVTEAFSEMSSPPSNSAGGSGTTSPNQQNQTLPTQSQGGQFGGGVPLPPTALRVYTTSVNVKPFSGEEVGHNVRSFIRECEDAMRTNNLTTEPDKIAFLRQYLRADSLAARTVLDSNYFNTQNYDEFVDAMMKTFGRVSASNYLGQIHGWIDYLLANARSQNTVEAQNGASRITNQAVSLLRDQGWIAEHEKQDVTKFLEVYHYLILLGDKYRKVSKTVSFDPSERMWDLHPRIMNKLDVDHTRAQLIVGKISEPETEPISYAAAAATSSGVVPRNTSTTSKRCTFCQRSGHTASQCYKKRNLKKQGKLGGTPGAAAQTARPAPAPPAQTPQRIPVQVSQTTPSQSAPRQDKYCKIHHTSNHSLDECHAVNRLRDRVQSMGNSGSAGTAPTGSPGAPPRASSGETHHPPHHHPK